MFRHRDLSVFLQLRPTARQLTAVERAPQTSPSCGVWRTARTGVYLLGVWTRTRPSIRPLEARWRRRSVPDTRQVRYANTPALREFILERMEELDYDAREVAKRSQGRMSHQTVYALIAGRTTTVHLRTLEGLA